MLKKSQLRKISIGYNPLASVHVGLTTSELEKKMTTLVEDGIEEKFHRDDSFKYSSFSLPVQRTGTFASTYLKWTSYI
jgi:hypothetical protein